MVGKKDDVDSKIVVGVDGSEASEQALAWAVEEARLRKARVVAVHAWQVPVLPAEIPPVPPIDPGVIPELRGAGEQLVAEIVRKVAGDEPDVPVEPVAAEGPPATVLVDAAADAELLVVGSHGHSGLMGLVLGSVSQQVVSHAPCPVVLHRHGDRE